MNWKFVIESFLDTYHLPFVHTQPGPVETAKDFRILDQVSPMGTHYPNGAADKPKGDEHFGVFSGLTEDQRRSQDVAPLFPNTLFDFVPEHIVFIRVEPVAADQIRETLSSVTFVLLCR